MSAQLSEESAINGFSKKNENCQWSFLGEAQPRRDKRHFLVEVYITFFRRPHERQSKRHHWKI
jgi:hypothetical protein